MNCDTEMKKTVNLTPHSESSELLLCRQYLFLKSQRVAQIHVIKTRKSYCSVEFHETGWLIKGELNLILIILYTYYLMCKCSF